MTIAVPNAGLTLTMTFLSWLVEGSLFTFLVSYSLSHDDFFYRIEFTYTSFGLPPRYTSR